MKKNRSNLLLAFILTVPVILFFISYWVNHSPDLIPTGFIQYDNPGYIAFARQYLDADSFHFFYSNPFNDSGNYDTIYFQPQILLFALLLKTGISGTVILTFFTIICSYFCFLIVIFIYDTIFPYSKHRLLSILFFGWGGGILFLADIPAQLIYTSVKHFFAGQALALDPGWGWWGLSFGRSLFFSCEAYYHLVFMAVILMVIKKRWIAALLLLFLLSSSHPFTGIELLSIIFGWSLLEVFAFRNPKIPYFFTVGVCALFLLHIFYYLYYLNSFPDHHSVGQQYSLNWRLRFYNMIPAYFLVGIFCVITVYQLKIKKLVGNTNNRLFITWFTIAFLLANHEIFIKPMQPLHFTRGYIWSSLFLLGLPGLHYFLSLLKKSRRGTIVLVFFSGLFLLDNSMWIIRNILAKSDRKSVRYISREEKGILDLLSAKTDNKSLIIGYSDEEEAVLPYLSTVHTKAWSWTSHPFTTPFIARKREAYNQFILKGSVDSSWMGKSCFFIFRKQDSLEMRRYTALNSQLTTILDTKSYKVVAARFPANH